MQSLKVIINSKTGLPISRSNPLAVLLDDKLVRDEVLEGEELVTSEGFSGKYKPYWTGSEWVETATQEEIAEIESKIVRPKTPLTTDQLYDVMVWAGVI
jgi:hypothetical protein